MAMESPIFSKLPLFLGGGGIDKISMLTITCFCLTFSTVSLLNNDIRAIKVHVNKPQYCRAGHSVSHVQPILIVEKNHYTCFFWIVASI